MRKIIKSFIENLEDNRDGEFGIDRNGTATIGEIINGFVSLGGNRRKLEIEGVKWYNENKGYHNIEVDRIEY